MKIEAHALWSIGCKVCVCPTTWAVSAPLSAHLPRSPCSPLQSPHSPFTSALYVGDFVLSWLHNCSCRRCSCVCSLPSPSFTPSTPSLSLSVCVSELNAMKSQIFPHNHMKYFTITFICIQKLLAGTVLRFGLRAPFSAFALSRLSCVCLAAPRCLPCSPLSVSVRGCSNWFSCRNLHNLPHQLVRLPLIRPSPLSTPLSCRKKCDMDRERERDAKGLEPRDLSSTGRIYARSDIKIR